MIGTRTDEEVEDPRGLTQQHIYVKEKWRECVETINFQLIYDFT